jgi:hypothetical protein
MEQSPGFVAWGGCEKVCHLRKSLYGLENLVKQLKSLA